VTVLLVVTGAAAGVGVWKAVEAHQVSVARSFAAGQNVVNVAKTSVVALLSYTPENVSAQLNAANALTTGAFHDSYSKLIDDVVIPGAQRAHIVTTATVPAAGLDSLSQTSAVVLAFVNQTATVGSDPPKDTLSSVRVGMQKVGGAWLIASFDPL
jgi:Mce-associated membrane protein